MEFSGLRDGKAWPLTRRDVVIRALGVTTAALAGLAVGARPGMGAGVMLGQQPGQPDWRFCGKCNGMFFSGPNGTYYRENQRCPAGGLHNPLGYNFVLPHDVPGTPTAQPDWRFCGKCNGMFFSGPNGTYYRDNQRCPAGELHNPLGYNFVLPHQGVPPEPSTTMTQTEQQVADLVNAARTRAGCAVALQPDGRLVAVARAHSQDLADHPGPPGLWEKGSQGGQGHYGSDGSLSADRISRAVGTSGTENSYVEWFTGTAPAPSAQRAFDWWWKSPYGHKESMLDCNHRTTGVGIATGQGFIPQGQPGAGQQAAFHYYTQAFVN
ncbi:MAG TPA: CAP domain-containing protein [Candidatus Limnocylindrales bacterium]